jgi:transglutaminase-like putative cysteine protease
MTSPRPRRTARGTSPDEVAAEVALVGIALATAASFTRLFETSGFLATMALAAVAGHLVAGLTRRAGWGLGRGALASAVGLTAFVSVSQYWETTALGIPTGHTASALRGDAQAAWTAFQDVTAPAPAEPGFVVALTVALWCAAFLADWAAFRLWSPVEAVVPTTALFVFSALLGTDDARVALTALFLAAMVSFQLLHHIAKQMASRHWINPDADRGSRTMVAGGLAMTIAAVLVAVVAGPSIPGAEQPAVIEWRDIGEGTPARVTVSPMVSIRSRLVDQSDLELFTVTASEPAYWRLTALDTFDGTIWKSSGSFQRVGDQLPREQSALPGEQALTQQYSIQALESLWLPVAFEPVRVDSADSDFVYEVETATLIVGSDLSTSDGMTYAATSVDATIDEALLTQEGDIPAEVADRFLELPGDFGDGLRIQAQEITRDATNDYQRARLLQDWFRAEFSYNELVSFDHDIDSIESFLEVREGYCEQFAGTFAAFARSLGIPARVAVGFTWGDRDPDEADLFRVTGRHAHAWPEVWLPGPGWVPFEPTPNRGIPRAEEVTGVAAQQEPLPGQPALPDTAPTTTTPDPEIPSGDAGAAPTPLPDLGLDTGGGGDGAAPEPTSGWGRLILPVAAALVLGLGEARRRRRRRRRCLGRGDGPPADPGTEAADASRRARLAWLQAIEQLELSGLFPLPAETVHEFAARIENCTDLDPVALAVLADGETAAIYGRTAPPLAMVERAEHAADEIGRWVRNETTWWQRALVALDPRPFLPTRPPVVQSEPTVATY